VTILVRHINDILASIQGQRLKTCKKSRSLILNILIMKTLILKKMMPLSVFVLGVAGAFGTMSMQKGADDLVPQIGWATNAQGEPCSVKVQCASSGGPLCRVSYPSGNIASDKPGTTCLQPLFRP
jgi:hypothetical protein